MSPTFPHGTRCTCKIFMPRGLWREVSNWNAHRLLFASLKGCWTAINSKVFMVINSEAWQSWRLCKYCNICRLYHCFLLISGQLTHKMQWHVNCFTKCQWSLIFGVFVWTIPKSLSVRSPENKALWQKRGQTLPSWHTIFMAATQTFWLRVIGICCHGKNLATPYLHNWQPQSG